MSAKSIARTLVLLLLFPAPGSTTDTPMSSTAASSFEVSSSSSLIEPFPITVTAPRLNEARVLKTTRAAGAGAGTTGLGMMAYAAYAGVIGPIGWIAAIFIVGGMTVAYLSNRRLQGHDDFSWGLQQEHESEFPQESPGGSAAAPENLERKTGRLEAPLSNP